jgi:7-cyano-7-deazaguanine reductase
MLEEILSSSPLGKNIPYLTLYSPDLLFRISRKKSRETLKISDSLPFKGVDIWNAYELSWLDFKGKPHVAIAEISISCNSNYLFESKSIKLYLHSFNQTQFESQADVQNILQKDLSELCEAPVTVSIKRAEEFQNSKIENFEGICIDDLEIKTDRYKVDANLLKVNPLLVEEHLNSNLLKSNCLVTNQPDWAHLHIYYKGNQIDHSSLLKYIVSYRMHDEFHEQCIERIFMDISSQCCPEKLSVYGRYTRRGGLDINPFRSSWEEAPRSNPRLFRQ